jgi:polyisoprenoid-binding protein YceI
MKKSFSAFTFATIALASILGCAPDKSAEARPVVDASARADTSSNAATAFRFVTDPAGTSARYRIREQLVGLDLPNDAVGETKGVTGVISADAKGKLIPAESKFTIDVTTLTSDKSRRDGFVRGRVLETDKFPTVTFVPTSIKGISVPLPKTGSKEIEVTGDLTVRGVTHPTSWKATAMFETGRITGKASTAFTFSDFGITQPRVPVVLSVADTIKLELDFSLVPDPSFKR